MVSKAKRRRERKRRAAVAGKRAQEEATRVGEGVNPDATALGVLTNPDDHVETASDLTLVKKSLRYGRLTPDKIDQVVDRVVGIALKTEVRVVGKDGEIHSVDGPADANSLKAADIIKGMVGQQQRDEHFDKRQSAPKQPTQTQVNIGVNIGTDERREKLSAIASRIGIDFVPEGSTAAEADSNPDAVVRVRKPEEGDGS